MVPTFLVFGLMSSVKPLFQKRLVTKDYARALVGIPAGHEDASQDHLKLLQVEDARVAERVTQIYKDEGALVDGLSGAIASLIGGVALAREEKGQKSHRGEGGDGYSLSLDPQASGDAIVLSPITCDLDSKF